MDIRTPKCALCALWLCLALWGGAGARATDAAAAAASPAAGARRLLSWSQLRGGNSSRSCAKAKPTLILLSGVGGSQMRGTFKGSADCAPLNGSGVIWYADHWYYNNQLPCWSRIMRLSYNATTKRYSNSSGVELWPDDGAVPGTFPEKSKQGLFYAVLMAHLKKAHGYVAGEDLFVVPFDWRVGVQGLEEHGGLDDIVRRISAGVKTNCGQKAIVMSHSYGANVMAAIFHKPEYVKWREDNVKGWVPVGAPFGGCAATTWLSQLSGDFFKLLPIVSNALLPPSVTSKWHPTVVGKSIYKLAFGYPTWGWMLPRPGVFAKDHVLIQTPTKNYTVAQQKQLMLDMGDAGGAALLDDTWARSEAVLEQGPVPGVETYCLYGVGVPTPATLIFNESIPEYAPISRPAKEVSTQGDGVVDINSLRLCSKFAPKDHIYEVSAPLVDHATILAHPLGLARLSEILHKLGAPFAAPWWAALASALTLGR